MVKGPHFLRGSYPMERPVNSYDACCYGYLTLHEMLKQEGRVNPPT